ncbi:GTP-binding protein LepA [Spongiimicrobium sp. 3-5]|uniref:GTP-binding protein LepA n=1 Tax=Spongiimicrobium sp. 3-5 TaxID=3332596 RepID=UPI00397EE4AE
MTTYIAEYKTTHKIIQIQEHSCFIWQQEGGEIDMEMLTGKIVRESSVHFFSLIAGKNYLVSTEDISVDVIKTEPFKG